jgi:tripartite-type tricarboxylate transporter receptor subunit TctC
MKRLFACMVPGMAALLLALSATAQTFPSKPVKIVVPFPPGGFNDVLGRTLAQEFQKSWNQPVVVDNRPGGNTIIGSDIVAKSTPDGHTLLVVALPFSVLPSLFAGRLPFDVVKDFAPVSLAAGSPNMLVVNPSVPVNNVKELIALAKAQPGKLTYASTGNGTSNHVSAEYFKMLTGTDLLHIPYKGSAPAVTDLIGGQVNVLFDNVPNVIQHVKAGKLKPLAVTSTKRSFQAPEVPTMQEAGVPDYEVNVWFGVLTTAGTPPDAVAKLNAETVRVLNLPEVRERFRTLGVEVIASSPEQFAQHLKSEIAKWGRVVREAKIRVD